MFASVTVRQELEQRLNLRRQLLDRNDPELARKIEEDIERRQLLRHERQATASEFERTFERIRKPSHEAPQPIGAEPSRARSASASANIGQQAVQSRPQHATAEFERTFERIRKPSQERSAQPASTAVNTAVNTAAGNGRAGSHGSTAQSAPAAAAAPLPVPAAAAAVVASANDSAVLPDGWLAQFDDNYKCMFYVNRAKLSCFLAFLLSCFLAFLLSCFLAFLLSLCHYSFLLARTSDSRRGNRNGKLRRMLLDV